MLFNQAIQKAALALLALVMCIGCQQNIEDTTTPKPLPSAIFNIDDPGYTLAQSLAVALQREDIRYFVKEKIDERFDGDANFLYALQEDQPVGGSNSRSLSFGQALFGKDAPGMRRANSLQAEPLLQIALRKAPGVTVDWNPAEGQPIVVYLPYGTDTDEVSSLPAFDKEGNYFSFDLSQLPTEPILVISHNERVQPVPRLKVDKLKARKSSSEVAPDDGCLMEAEPIMVTDEDYYYYTSDVYCGGTGGTPLQPGGLNEGQGTEGTNGLCDREGTTLYDHISRVKFVNMEEFNLAETWITGAPEIFFFVFTGSKQGHLQSFKKRIPKVDHSEWKDCPLLSSCYPEWHYPDLEVFYWDKADFGEILKYQWFEHDEGDPVKFKTDYSVKQDDGSTLQLSFEVTISAKDYDLGNTLVYHCENALPEEYKVYETGSIYYALELR